MRGTIKGLTQKDIKRLEEEINANNSTEFNGIRHFDSIASMQAAHAASPLKDGTYKVAGASTVYVSDGVNLTCGTDTLISKAALIAKIGTSGMWLDANDLTTLFQDVNGIIPANSVGNSIRKIFDKSGNGNHVTFSGTTPPTLQIDSDGIYYLQPVDTTSRGINTTLNITSGEFSALVVAAFTSAASQTLFDSYNAAKASAVLKNSTLYCSVGGNSVGITADGTTSKAIYSVNFEQYTSHLRIDSYQYVIGNTDASGLNGLSLFNVRGNPTPVIDWKNTSPFYGLIISKRLSISDEVLAETYLKYAYSVNVNKNPSGFIIGDSTSTAYPTGQGLNATDYYLNSEKVLYNLAVPAQTIAQQMRVFADASNKKSASWVLMQVGLNDLAALGSETAALAAIQTLVTRVKSNVSPSCKILVAQLSPCKAAGTVNYTAWTNFNAGLSATTGVDAFITAHVAALNDGAGNLAAAYNSGDGIHPNNAGHQVIAKAWMDSLNTLGIL